MKRVTIKMGQTPIARDLQAQAMWGRVKAQTFRDKRKVLPRKAKHKALLAGSY
jgi:hypothetical protein